MNDIKFATRKVIGPPLSKGDAIGQFMKAHKSSMLMSVEDGRVVAIEKARYPDAQALISELHQKQKYEVAFKP